MSDLQVHILNMGMGVESVCILLRWILEPHTRPFKSWSQLIVISAQTGDELDETKYLMERFILPLMAQLGIRYVQIAKKTASKLDGYVILSDTTAPTVLHTEGCCKLSDDLMASGTVPRLGRPHICAQRWKGEILDGWTFDNIYEHQIILTYIVWLIGQAFQVTKNIQPSLFDDVTENRTQPLRFQTRWMFWAIAKFQALIFGPYLGYNVDEQKRAAKADGYTARGHDFIYPVILWDWTRDDCIEYIYFAFGVIWRKSACKQCPFPPKEAAIARFLRDPIAGGFTLMMELNALAFNPRMHLFSCGTAYDLMRDSGNVEALDNLNQRLDECGWAVYHVRRTYKQIIGKNGKPYSNSDRWVRIISEGEKVEMERFLRVLAQEHLQEVMSLHGSRFYIHVRVDKVYPAWEEFFVVAPKIAKDKCRNPIKFEQNWQTLTGANLFKLADAQRK